MSLREDVGNIYKSCLNKLDPADTVYAYLKSNSDLFDNHKRVYLIAFGSFYNYDEGLFGFYKKRDAWY